MKKVVIAGSASLQEEITFWKKMWEDNRYVVINYPKAISSGNFLELYPKVHTDFFKSIQEADVLFVMNEDKDDTEGYIGAEAFAELSFGVIEKLVNKKDIEIILLKIPSEQVQSHEEIELWLKLGWIEIYKQE